MNAKEKQSSFIKEYLKPLLKQQGYSTKGQTWWRDQGDFFVLINLQNFSWNTKDDVSFCFNIGIALKIAMKNTDAKPSQFDLTVRIRHEAYLPDSNTNNTHKNKTGYLITPNTDIDDFLREIKSDFEQEILPCLDKLKNINDCLAYYGDLPFWGDHLKRIISENTK